jgi:cutinase
MNEMGSDRIRRARWLLGDTRARLIACFLGTAAMVTAWTMLGPPTVLPSASAQPCPDVEVVFARGTFEPPGVGVTGQAFIDSLRARAGGKSVEIYPVNYPASLDFRAASQGVIDASNRVLDVANRCPDTKMVLGGYSQGAAVIAYITADAIPDGYTPPNGITGPMPPEVADHVAAVALFGKPSNGFLQRIEPTAPPITIGRLYSDKAVDLCIAQDPVCAPDGNDQGTHVLYNVNGMTDQAADFSAARLASTADEGDSGLH